MKSIAIFNNKGGVGKTTLTYHVAYALAELGHKTLLLDLDPQSNLTLYGISPEDLHSIWIEEDPFIDDYQAARNNLSDVNFEKLLKSHRSCHFLLKPTEDGTGELEKLAVPISLHKNLDLVPGRLSLHMYEDKIASRWSDAFLGDPLGIRTLTKIRSLCKQYAEQRGYELVMIDTSPSLGILNKIIISTSDGFVIPCMPDMFSLYGIRNIGRSIEKWKREFDTMYSLLSDFKRENFPENFVRFLGFTIFNAKKYSGGQTWDLAQAHYNYASQIPETITDFIPKQVLDFLGLEQLSNPIGGTAVMHSHSTMPTMAQKYRQPIWMVPSTILEPDDRRTIMGNRARFEETQEGYHQFANDLLDRISKLS
jgi:cellulose biosynthesis protein BcsQ